MKNRDDESDVYAIRAASLCSRGLLQQQIASELGISQPEVSRLLKRAREQKWLEFLPPRFHCPDSAKKLWEVAESKFSSCPEVRKRLTALYPTGASKLNRIALVYTDENEDFRQPIAPVIQELLTDVKIVGVTWGRVIRHLVDKLTESLSTHLVRQDPIQFVPLCGEPLKDRADPVGYSSSALAARFSAIFNGLDYPPPPSLAGVPAFVPLKFKKKGELETIRRFIRDVAGYDTVFGTGADASPQGPEAIPLIDRAECFVTSVGIVRSERRGIFLTERVKLKDITEDELKEWVVGDIGGVMLAREGISDAGARRINDMNERWTGIQLHHITRCASEANKDKPGVIVLARGNDRVDMVKRCVQLGLINVLIIDQHLAKALTS